MPGRRHTDTISAQKGRTFVCLNKAVATVSATRQMAKLFVVK